MSARLALAALAAMGIVGCTEKTVDAPESETVETTNQTVASVVAGEDRFAKLAWALADTQLAPVLDGQGDYTLLAFDDRGFAKLGDKADALTSTGERPLLAAILRAHILPGQITPAAIHQAIERKNGPVEMRTLAGDIVTFAETDDGTTVSNGSVTARLEGNDVAAINGAVLTIDRVLMPAG